MARMYKVPHTVRMGPAAHRMAPGRCAGHVPWSQSCARLSQPVTESAGPELHVRPVCRRGRGSLRLVTR
jgi:hypothetical protein